jgi:hypothetical protein
MKRLVLIFSLCGIISASCLSQQQASDFNSHVSIKLLKQLNDSVFKGSTDSVKIRANEMFRHEFKNYLLAPESFENEFDSLRVLTRARSDDGKVRLLTWMVQTDNFNHYNNFGFVQYKPEKDKPALLFELIDTGDTATRPLNKIYSASNWYSALYYKIITTKKKKETFYTLLGWKGKNKFSTIKVIDVLYFTGDKPFFGQKIINYENKIQSRLIFEFNSEAVMMLRYDANLEMIVFDHLGPQTGILDNNYSQYGPDFSFDGLKFEKGIWKYYKDIDLRNGTEGEKQPEKKSKEFYDPNK